MSVIKEYRIPSSSRCMNISVPPPSLCMCTCPPLREPVLAVSWCGMRRLTQRKQLRAAGPGRRATWGPPGLPPTGLYRPRGLGRFHQGLCLLAATHTHTIRHAQTYTWKVCVPQQRNFSSRRATFKQKQT